MKCPVTIFDIMQNVGHFRPLDEMESASYAGASQSAMILTRESTNEAQCDIIWDKDEDTIHVYYIDSQGMMVWILNPTFELVHEDRQP